MTFIQTNYLIMTSGLLMIMPASLVRLTFPLNGFKPFLAYSFKWDRSEQNQNYFVLKHCTWNQSQYVETQLTYESRRIQLENYTQNTSYCDESLQKIEEDVMQSSLYTKNLIIYLTLSTFSCGKHGTVVSLSKSRVVC